MGIQFACTQCGSGYSVENNDAGRLCKCGNCGTITRVPGAPDELDCLDVELSTRGRFRQSFLRFRFLMCMTIMGVALIMAGLAGLAEVSLMRCLGCIVGGALVLLVPISVACGRKRGMI